MPVLSYDYAIVRVLPRVERGEQLNAGVILSCAAAGYLRASFELDEDALRCVAPGLDLEPIRAALAGIEAVCAGGTAAGQMGRLSVRERFHWLVAPRSTSVQVSAVHTGRCADLDAALDDLMRKMVRRGQS
ncbi:MAG: DUF3037 domain-containing protein [Burkholderiaceae bacterium]|nr:DUF3037 domain-containing protein [Burkholderiaceae bacterium]